METTPLELIWLLAFDPLLIATAIGIVGYLYWCSIRSRVAALEIEAIQLEAKLLAATRAANASELEQLDAICAGTNLLVSAGLFDLPGLAVVGGAVKKLGYAAGNAVWQPHDNQVLRLRNELHESLARHIRGTLLGRIIYRPSKPRRIERVGSALIDRSPVTDALWSALRGNVARC